MALKMALNLAEEWAKRPWWINLLLLFCLFMTFIYSPFDVVFKPLAEDEDVWFGYMFFGWAAKIGGVVHWVVYAALAWGLWFMRPWAWWLASLYATQVAIAMLLWPILQDRGIVGGLVAGAVFSVPAIALWRGRHWFTQADDSAQATA